MRATVRVLLVAAVATAGCNGGAVNEEAQKLLVRGSMEGDIALMERALLQGADINREYSLSSPLAWAVLNDHLVSAKFLVSRGAHVDAHYGLPKRTALQEAALRGHLEMAKYLLGAGAKINARNRFGRTALHHARNGLAKDQRKAEEVARFLIRNGGVE